MSVSLHIVRLGRHHGPPEDDPQVRAAAAELAALRVDTLLAYDELSVGQLARRLDVDRDRLAHVLDDAELLGLVRCREGRYGLTRAGERLRERLRERRGRRPVAVPAQRRTTLVG